VSVIYKFHFPMWALFTSLISVCERYLQVSFLYVSVIYMLNFSMSALFTSFISVCEHYLQVSLLYVSVIFQLASLIASGRTPISSDALG